MKQQVLYACMWGMLLQGMHIYSNPLVEVIRENNVQHEVTLALKLADQEVLFHDTMLFSFSHPDYTLVSWKASAAPFEYIDPSSKERHMVYSGNFSVTLSYKVAAGVEASEEPIELFFHYVSNKERFPQEQHILLFSQTVAPAPQIASHASRQDDQDHSAAAKVVYEQDMVKDERACKREELSFSSLIYRHISNSIKKSMEYGSQLLSYVKGIFSHTSSPYVRVFLTFLLGVLMSLTPCIYPMIPITVGVLGASGSNSWVRNFMLAAAYTGGMAIMFALLGLSTVFFGMQFGSLFQHTWFIAGMACFLAYCGGSMMGWYEFYIPSFLSQQGVSRTKQGSYVSAFIFGVLTGTMASPCMSPGLALVLTHVASSGSYVGGFITLFMFGVGSSLPLLIIGTFSQSVSMMPRAGVWMNDIKYIFGLLLFALSFSYVRMLVPVPYAYGAEALFFIAYGLWYGSTASLRTSWMSTLFVLAVSIGCVVRGGLQALGAYGIVGSAYAVPWKTYTCVRDDMGENQYMLLDFTADWCSLCKLIEKNVLQDPAMKKVYESGMIPVKVDATVAGDAAYEMLAEKYQVVGQPTLILIRGPQGTEIKRWGSEVRDITPEQFARELIQYTTS